MGIPLSQKASTEKTWPENYSNKKSSAGRQSKDKFVGEEVIRKNG